MHRIISGPPPQIRNPHNPIFSASPTGGSILNRVQNTNRLNIKKSVVSPVHKKNQIKLHAAYSRNYGWVSIMIWSSSKLGRSVFSIMISESFHAIGHLGQPSAGHLTSRLDPHYWHRQTYPSVPRNASTDVAILAGTELRPFSKWKVLYF